MDVRILGCSGSRYPGSHSPAYLLDKRLLLDAGTVCGQLGHVEQEQIEAVLVSHAHLDHIKELANLADNYLVNGLNRRLPVYGPEPVLAAMRLHIFNNSIWPDFSLLPSREQGILHWHPCALEQPFTVAGYTVTPITVAHPVPAVGYRITSGDATILYTGDTGPTDKIWQLAGETNLLIVEVSFPNEMQALALASGHLTAALLRVELAKVANLPAQILVVHLKDHYRHQITAELAALGISQLVVAEEGKVYHV